MEAAENRPWKMVAAMHSILVPTYMRTRGLTQNQALQIVNSIVDKLGFLGDDEDPEKIKNKLLTMIYLGD